MSLLLKPVISILGYASTQAAKRPIHTIVCISVLATTAYFSILESLYSYLCQQPFHQFLPRRYLLLRQTLHNGSRLITPPITPKPTTLSRLDLSLPAFQVPASPKFPMLLIVMEFMKKTSSFPSLILILGLNPFLNSRLPPPLAPRKTFGV